MTDWADEIAWEVYHGMGTIALGLGEAVQRQAARDVLEPALRKARADALEEAIYVLVNMDCPDENAPEVTYKTPWYDGVGAAEDAIRALKDKQP